LSPFLDHLGLFDLFPAEQFVLHFGLGGDLFCSQPDTRKMQSIRLITTVNRVYIQSLMVILRASIRDGGPGHKPGRAALFFDSIPGPSWPWDGK